ncbi:MAG: lactate racemase domain-containing protein [Gemmataceae bacterium]|nr:lactate racemase domain-containing protein [Gemmataceae bacterium]
MRVKFGQHEAELHVPAENVVAVHRASAAPPLADPAAAVAAALEQPLGFPPLRRALTPDDHVAIVVDESIAALPRLLPPALRHLQEAGVQLDAVTLVCAPPSTGQPWLEELPDEFHDVRIEVHQPEDRKKLAYLATTRQGRRIYLNRTVVDADQTVVLTRRGYDSLLGYSGGAGTLYPALCDAATLRETHSHLSLAAPGAEPWKLKREAAEVAWLLGVPFLVQVIEGSGGAVVHVLGGPVETSTEGERLLDERWRIEVDEPADAVVATLSGDPARHGFAEFGSAWAAAARVVKPDGVIVLLSDAAPVLGVSAEMMRAHEHPGEALKHLKKEPPSDLEPGYQWASAAATAKLYLLSRLNIDVAEELFTTPLESVGQAQKLLRGRCLFLPDAHQTMAVVR